MLNRGHLGETESSCTRERSLNGVLAFGNELQEAVKTICGRLNFEDAARFQSKRRRAGDEGHVQFLVSLIKRNVEKDVS